MGPLFLFVYGPQISSFGLIGNRGLVGPLLHLCCHHTVMRAFAGMYGSGTYGFAGV